MTVQQYQEAKNFTWSERDIKGRLLRDHTEGINYMFFNRLDRAITDAKSSYGNEAGQFRVYDFLLDKHNPDGYHPKGRAVDGVFRGLNHFQSFLIFERWRFGGIGLYPFTMPDKIVHVDDREDIPALRWVRNPDSYIYSLTFFEGYLKEEILLHPTENENERGMTEQDFLRKIGVLNARLASDYWDGEEIDGVVKALELLCHNFIEMKKIRLKDESEKE